MFGVIPLVGILIALTAIGTLMRVVYLRFDRPRHIAQQQFDALCDKLSDVGSLLNMTSSENRDKSVFTFCQGSDTLTLEVVLDDTAVQVSSPEALKEVLSNDQRSSTEPFNGRLMSGPELLACAV